MLNIVKLSSLSFEQGEVLSNVHVSPRSLLSCVEVQTENFFLVVQIIRDFILFQELLNVLDRALIIR